MANVMSFKAIRNNPSRDGFDLSRKINYTSKGGELLPILMLPVLPGDSFTIDVNEFTRTQPVNTAAYARNREYIDFYFVPLEQLWINAPTVLTQMKDNVQRASSILGSEVLSGDMPYFTCEQLCTYLNGLDYNGALREDEKKNPFGFYRSPLTAKLLEYLGYGNAFRHYARRKNDSTGEMGLDYSSDPLISNLKLNPFPLLAYQKIYADYYRFTQWESPNPATFNVDYIKGTNDLNIPIPSYSTSLSSFEEYVQDFTMFDLRYCNYQKDMFHGVVPVAQFGEAAVVPISGSMTGHVDAVTPSFTQSTSSVSGNPTYQFTGTSTPKKVELGLDSSGYHGLKVDPSVWTTTLNEANMTVSVLALRQAEFLQKWKEIAVSAEEDYKSQIQAHWNVSVSDYLSGQSRYLGGTATSLDINEVVNTNLQSDGDAKIQGKGIGASRGTIRFESRGEYGIIMAIKHTLPLLDYVTSGVDPYCAVVNAESYPIPEMDKIGMEQVPLVYAVNGVKSDFENLDDTSLLGYAPRYFSWKTAVDRSLGAFSDSMSAWVNKIDDQQFLQSASTMFSDNPQVSNELVNAGFFKVNPAIYNNLFAVNADSWTSTDQFLSTCYFDVKVVRNLDRDGLPY